MPTQDDKPRHGDPLSDVINSNREREENQAQRDSDAPPDAVAEKLPPGDPNDERAIGRHSNIGGVSQADEDAGTKRKELYRKSGAPLVSRID